MESIIWKGVSTEMILTRSEIIQFLEAILDVCQCPVQEALNETESVSCPYRCPRRSPSVSTECPGKESTEKNAQTDDQDDRILAIPYSHSDIPKRNIFPSRFHLEAGL